MSINTQVCQSCIQTRQIIYQEIYFSQQSSIAPTQGHGYYVHLINMILKEYCKISYINNHL